MASPDETTHLLDTASYGSVNHRRLSRTSCHSHVSTIEDAATESTVANVILSSRRRFSSRFINTSDNDFGEQSEFDSSALENEENDQNEGHISASLSQSARPVLVGNTSWVAAVIIMTNCTIGMGLLSFPRSFADAGGLRNGLIVEAVVILLVIGSLAMMGKCCLQCEELSFQAVIEHFAGRWFGLLAKCIIFINNFGACIVSLVVLGDQIERVVWLVSPESVDICSTWYLDRRLLVVLVGVLVIMPLSMPSRFEVFKYTSFLGVIAAAYIAFGVAITRYFTGTSPADHPNPIQPPNVQILKIIPIICFSFECHIELPPMAAVLKKNTQSYFMRMVFGYIFLSTLIYSIGGIFGYLTFGDSVVGDFLLNYSRKDPLVSVATFLLMLKVMTTYPVVFFCLRSVVMEGWMRIRYLHYRVPANSTSFRIFITVILFSITMGVALVAPGITEAISLIGALSGACIFVFPGLCFMQFILESTTKVTKCQRCLGVAAGAGLIAVGAFVIGAVLTMSVSDFIIQKHHPAGLCN